MDDDNSTSEPATPVSELLADEVADVALDDPERAAQLVAAVAPAPGSTPSATGAPSTSSAAGPFASPPANAAGGTAVPQRAVPAALAVVLLLQVMVRGRFRRLVLAAVGAGLVAALVRGTQEP